MPPAATTIPECIEFCPNYTALVAYESADSLLTQFDLWLAGLFGAAGVFPQPNGNASATVRAITNWYAQHVIAREEIEGPLAGDAGPVGVAAVINAVVRILYAINTHATNAQKTAVIALFNTCFA